MVAEVMGGLDHRDPRVVEIAHRGIEDVRLGNMVGVEHEEQLGIDHAEGVVDVARLGVTIVGAGDIAGTGPLGQRAHEVPTTIVEHPGHVRVGDPPQPRSVASRTSGPSS